MNILIVYCHPSNDSFTYQVKESFLKGLAEQGHDYIISDLYEMNFNPVISKMEYKREAFYSEKEEIPDDVKDEQRKMDASDVIVFIYPVFWTAAPAMLEGWFQRVWTYGYAYGKEPKMKAFKKALFLVTMGGTIKEQLRRQQVEAMERIMIGDRMHNRADECQVIVFDEMTRGYGNDEHRENNAIRFTKQAYKIAAELDRT